MYCTVSSPVYSRNSWRQLKNRSKIEANCSDTNSSASFSGISSCISISLSHILRPERADVPHLSLNSTQSMIQNRSSNIHKQKKSLSSTTNAAVALESTCFFVKVLPDMVELTDAPPLGISWRVPGREWSDDNSTPNPPQTPQRDEDPEALYEGSHRDM